MPSHSLATPVAVDPTALLRLRGAVQEAAGVFDRAASDLAGVSAFVGQIEGWSWRLHLTGSWLREQDRDLARRVLVLPPEPGGGTTPWDQWSRAAESLLEVRPLPSGGWAIGAGVRGMRDVGRSVDLVAGWRREYEAVADLVDGPGARLIGAEDELRRLGRLSSVADDVAPWVRGLDAGFGVVGAVGDVATLVDPPHEGWYGAADRGVAAVSLGAGAAQLGASLGLVALGPAGATAIGVIAIGTGVYAIGSYAYDHRQQIGRAIGSVRDASVDAAGEVVDAAGDVLGAGAEAVETAYEWSGEQLDRALDGVGDAAERVGGWVGRAFGFGG